MSPAPLDNELESAPYLDADPPHWAARGLAYFVIGLFVVSLIGAVFINVPETVSGPFVLVPSSGSDPVRSPRKGQVVAVRVLEGQTVERGDPLFVLQSEPLGDRLGELAALQAQLRGSDGALRNLESAYEDGRRADEQQRAILQSRLASLERTVQLKRERQQLAQQLADRYRAGYERQELSLAEYTPAQLESQELAEELEAYENEYAETRATIEKLRHEMAARAAAHREGGRALDESRERMRIRIATLDQDLTLSDSGQLQVQAPCAGTVLQLRVSTAGAVVQEGDVLSDVACSGQLLQAELAVPPGAVARLRAGQGVKMLYDAFPYQRYGVRHGRVRWVSPAGIAASTGTTSFRALVDLEDSGIRVDGQLRPYLAGMGGEVRVIVGRRSLVSYAFEPIRQLRESMAEAPSGET
ncbi:MAG TPA: HlyD family efflux transporter periplasmic adaptor subunit [Gemmatimonadaceae bacterium]|nr:HlyD family efflux transporter periplasmic adaptor subunit [Gemmatimonadaceae bacterium]